MLCSTGTAGGMVVAGGLVSCEEKSPQIDTPPSWTNRRSSFLHLFPPSLRSASAMDPAGICESLQMSPVGWRGQNHSADGFTCALVMFIRSMSADEDSATARSDSARACSFQTW